MVRHPDCEGQDIIKCVGLLLILLFCSVYILGNQTQLITQSVNWLLIGNKYKIDRFLRKVLQIFTEGFTSVSFFSLKKNEMHSHVYVHDKNLVLKF